MILITGKDRNGQKMYWDCYGQYWGYCHDGNPRPVHDDMQEPELYRARHSDSQRIDIDTIATEPYTKATP